MKKRKMNKPLMIFTTINIIFAILLVAFIASLNMVPTKYIVLLSIILLVVNVICFILIKNKKKGLKITGYVISVIFMIISIVGSYFINKANSFLNDAFNNAENTYTNTYYVVTKNDDKYSEIEDLKYRDIGYYKNIPNIDLALDKLKEVVDSNNKDYEDIIELIGNLEKEKIDAMLIESSLYDVLVNESKVIDEDDYKILYEFEIVIEEEIEEFVDDGNSFSIYIGGVDFTEKNTDLNMIVTVNKKTHKILLTSIPRDYYVQINGKGMKDLLGYAGYFGINTSRKTVADLFDTSIDFYIKINTSSLIGLVDTLGGVEFCSDISYTTTHALVTGTYDDTKGEKLYVQKGCKTYNGIEILTISRERKAYTDGDRQRQKNCQAIMISIFKKMTSSENIANYSNVLNAVSDLYTTNIPRELVTELAKDTIDNGASWTFEQQSVTGRDSSGYVHMNTVKDYVMIPNEDSLNEAITAIKKIRAGK